MNTRAIFRAVEIPAASAPYNCASLKIYYPARYSDSAEERNSGVVPANPEQAPFPVLIMMPGINLGPEAYRWLAESLAKLGIATVTYSLIAEEMPGYISLTPGLDIGRLRFGEFGKAPSATAIGAILAELAQVNASGVLANCLDLQRIVLGGHSAGGTTALLNARPDWFPAIKAVFSYGAHTAASTLLGHPEGTLLPVSSELPVLVIGGSEDGCIANSGQRYGGSGPTSATEKVEQTFHEAVSGGRGDCYLAIIDGANHFSLAYPPDATTGRPFIDFPETRDNGEIRVLLAQLIGQFIQAHVAGDTSAAAELKAGLSTGNSLIKLSAQK